MNWSAGEVADVPLALETVMSTVPAGTSGEFSMIVVELTTVYEGCGVMPKATEVTVIKP